MRARCAFKTPAGAVMRFSLPSHVIPRRRERRSEAVRFTAEGAEGPPTPLRPRRSSALSAVGDLVEHE